MSWCLDNGLSGVSCQSCMHIVVFPIYIFITVLCMDKAKNEGDLGANHSLDGLGQYQVDSQAQ